MKEKIKKIAIIVVTYNRKELLEKNINALLEQEYKNYDIIIIDNASTDNTKEKINKYIEEKKIIYLNTGENLGGAGGFSFGIAYATKEEKYSHLWLMDDDTIPQKNALKKLIEAHNLLDEYGFLSSVVLWKNGKYCRMNCQKLNKPWYEEIELLKYGILPTYYATFVSFFIPISVVKQVGLPIQEFFIWADDVEYTNRIAYKFPCYIVGQSSVLHETQNNEGANIAKDDIKRLSRYKYMYRNEMYIAKQKKLKGVIIQIMKICLHISRVILYSKNYKLRKIYIILFNSFLGIFFNPRIKYVEMEK